MCTQLILPPRRQTQSIPQCTHRAVYTPPSAHIPSSIMYTPNIRRNGASRETYRALLCPARTERKMERVRGVQGFKGYVIGFTLGGSRVGFKDAERFKWTVSGGYFLEVFEWLKTQWLPLGIERCSWKGVSRDTC